MRYHLGDLRLNFHVIAGYFIVNMFSIRYAEATNFYSAYVATGLQFLSNGVDEQSFIIDFPNGTLIFSFLFFFFFFCRSNKKDVINEIDSTNAESAD